MPDMTPGNLMGQPLAIYSMPMIEDIIMGHLERNNLLVEFEVQFVWTYDRAEYPNGVMIVDAADIQEAESE